MKKILVLLFLLPNLLFAQSDLQGDWWRLEADTTALGTLGPGVEMPKCLVDEVLSQCRLVFAGAIINKSFPLGGPAPDVIWTVIFDLVVEPMNPKYETGSTVIEISDAFVIPLLFIDTGTGIIALCEVSFIKEEPGETYRVVTYVPCGDDTIVPVTEQFIEPLAPADFILNTIPTATDADEPN